MIFKRTFEECVSLFSYQRSLLSRRLTDSFDILSCCFRLVKNFFYFFSNPFESFLFRILSCFVFLRRNSDIISSVFWFVNKFFQIFWFFQTSTFSGISDIPAVYRQFQRQLCQDTTTKPICQPFFNVFIPNLICKSKFHLSVEFTFAIHLLISPWIQKNLEKDIQYA